MLAASLTVLAAGPVAAQGTSEQRAACTGDAMRLCLSAVPDVGRITACMKSHYGDLSPRCQATFNEGSRGGGDHAAPPRKLAEEPAKPVEGKQPESKQAESRQPESRQAESRQAGRRLAEAKAERERDAARQASLRREAARREVPRRDAAAALPRERVATGVSPLRRTREGGEAAPHEAFRRHVASREPPARSAPLAESTEEVSPERVPPYPDVAGATIAAPPRPRLVTALPASAGNLALACREGLIDSYTCGHTIPTLGLGE